MRKPNLNQINNEDGFVLGGSILISAILILAGTLALWTSTTEVQVVRNEGLMVSEFYDAEGGIIDALANYNNGSTDWLTDTFLMTPQADAFNVVVSNDAQGVPIADIEVPTGSGYSLKYFEVRRYGVTGRSADGNTTIQVGAWKVFNK